MTPLGCILPTGDDIKNSLPLLLSSVERWTLHVHGHKFRGNLEVGNLNHKTSVGTNRWGLPLAKYRPRATSSSLLYLMINLWFSRSYGNKQETDGDSC